jgi:hypothetical protein
MDAIKEKSKIVLKQVQACKQPIKKWKNSSQETA